MGAFLGRGRRPFFSVLDPAAKRDSYTEVQAVRKKKNMKYIIKWKFVFGTLLKSIKQKQKTKEKDWKNATNFPSALLRAWDLLAIALGSIKSLKIWIYDGISSTKGTIAQSSGASCSLREPG